MTDVVARLRDLAPDDATYFSPNGGVGRVIGVGASGSELVEMTIAVAREAGELRVSTGFQDLFADWPADTEPDPWENEVADRLRLLASAEPAAEPPAFTDVSVVIDGETRPARTASVGDLAVLVAHWTDRYVFVLGPRSAVSGLAALESVRVRNLLG